MLQGPPKDVPASELFLKLLEPQPSDVIDFPRKGSDGNPVGKIRVAVLSHEQHDRARISAFEYFKGKGFERADLEHVSMREVVGDRIAKELIAIACLTEKSQLDNADTGHPVYGRIFRDADDVSKLRAEEVTVLFSAYQLVQRKYGPLEYTADVDAWVRRLAEGGETYPLLSLDLPELASLTSSLAARLFTISRDLGSQWDALPSTLQSRLEKSCTDIGFWSKQQESSTDHSENSDEDDIDLDVDDAIELSRKTRANDRLKDALDIED